MTLYYLISNPADVRDLSDQVAAWRLAGNPKANDWAIQPPPPSQNAVWGNGAWILPEPTPVPDWARFKAAVLADPTINATLAQALTIVPAAATALAPTLLAVEQGLIADFASAWRAVLAAAPLPAGTLDSLVALATDCHLPVEFVAAFTPAET